MEEQVFGRVAAHGELGENHQVGALRLPHLVQHRDDLVGVATDIAHRKILLGER